MSTIEQELEQLITDADYRVIVYGFDGAIKLTLLYVPKLSIRGSGGMGYIANGNIGEAWFRTRNSKRRWQRASKWVREEIAGHRELIRTVGQA